MLLEGKSERLSSQWCVVLYVSLTQNMNLSREAAMYNLYTPANTVWCAILSYAHKQTCT